ncbi:MAG: hypothetical protein IIU46_13010, partial [Treponema sp.]|nr:hypothetical protein [Treponema sp.]
LMWQLYLCRPHRTIGMKECRHLWNKKMLKEKNYRQSWQLHLRAAGRGQGLVHLCNPLLYK